jgi:hypothetical protein
VSDEPPVPLGYFPERDVPVRWGIHRGAAYVLFALALVAVAGWAVDRLKPRSDAPQLPPDEWERFPIVVK